MCKTDDFLDRGPAWLTGSSTSLGAKATLKGLDADAGDGPPMGPTWSKGSMAGVTGHGVLLRLAFQHSPVTNKPHKTSHMWIFFDHIILFQSVS